MENDNIVNLLRDEFKHVNDRLDMHYEMFQQHAEDDKQAWNKLEAVDREIAVTKRVGAALIGATTLVIGWLGFTK